MLEGSRQIFTNNVSKETTFYLKIRKQRQKSWDKLKPERNEEKRATKIEKIKKWFPWKCQPYINKILTRQNPIEILGNVAKFADRLLNRFRVINAKSQHPSHPSPPPKEQRPIRVKLWTIR